MVALQQVTKADGAEAVLDALARDGGVIVRDMIAPDVLTAFRADMETAAASHRVGTVSDNPSVQRFWGRTTQRFTRLAHRSPAFVDILTDPFYLAVADGLLLPNCTDYWMNTGQMMIIGPGEKAQWIHRDSDNWPMMCRREAPEVTVSCMYAITDFDAEVGATQVVPGSHLWDDYSRKPLPEEICQAVMPAGGGMIYTGRVLHGGGANTTTDRWRFGLHLSYLLGWLTPEEAGPLATPWETAQHLPRRAQELLGWHSIGNRNPAASRMWTVDYEDVTDGLGLSASATRENASR